MNKSKNRIEIYDVTLRDGAQMSGISFSLKDKLELTERLDDFGVDMIEGGYPLSNPKDAEYFSNVQTLSLQHSRIAAFGMTRRRGLLAKDDPGMQTLLKSGAPVITIVGKSWDLHVDTVLQISERENADMIADSILLMTESGRDVVYDAEHFFDGYRENPDFALRTLLAAREAGAGCLVLCDTNGASMPEDIHEIVSTIKKNIPDVAIGIHCHNDAGLALANSLAAVRAGCSHVQGTVNGLGERCGNADLITLVANLALKYDLDVLIAGAMAIGFLTSWIFADLVALPLDLYYGVYFVVISSFFVLYGNGWRNRLRSTYDMTCM
jgi:2-isopropylmalate synthase